METLELAGDIYAAGPDESEFPELWDGLVGLWSPSWSGPTGLELIDFSGNQNHGTLTNMDAATDWVVDGERGWVNDYDGSDDEVIIPDSASLSITQNITLTAWIYPRAVAANYVVVEKGEGTLATISYYMAIRAAKLNFVIQQNATTGNNQNSISNIAVNTWSHVAVTWDGSVMRFYINGDLDRAVASTISSIQDTAALTGIGGIPNSAAWPFDGQIGPASIYSIAQPDNAMASMSAGASPLTPARRRVTKAPAAVALMAMERAISRRVASRVFGRVN